MQKKMVLLQFGFRATLALSICAAAVAQTRPPAVPLITHNPYFSIWSLADHLTDESTKHWTGAEQALTGLVQIDGKPYRFMGNRPDRIPALHQDQLQITPVHTRYTFTGNGIGLELTFLTPAFPEDLDVLSRPVTYVTWNIHATDGKTHDVKIYFDADGRVAVDKGDQQVVWRRSRAKRMTVLSVGSREQQPLSRSGDDLRIDWGYFHLAVPDAQSAETAESIDAVDEFIKNGNLPDADEMDMPRSPNAGAAHLAVMFSLGKLARKRLAATCLSPTRKA